MSASLHVGVSVGWKRLQPKGSETSMPITTASLPSFDHLAGLCRALDDPVPALAGAAALRVDVALQLPHALGLAADGLHLVAVVRRAE